MNDDLTDKRCSVSQRYTSDSTFTSYNVALFLKFCCYFTHLKSHEISQQNMEFLENVGHIKKAFKQFLDSDQDSEKWVFSNARLMQRMKSNSLQHNQQRLSKGAICINCYYYIIVIELLLLYYYYYYYYCCYYYYYY